MSFKQKVTTLFSSYDANIRIWNFQNQNLCTQESNSLGQKMLVSSRFDDKIKLWNLAELNN